MKCHFKFTPIVQWSMLTRKARDPASSPGLDKNFSLEIFSIYLLTMFNRGSLEKYSFILHVSNHAKLPFSWDNVL